MTSPLYYLPHMHILTIPGEFTSLNEYIRAERGRFGMYQAGKIKKEETERVAWLAKRVKIETPCYFVFKWTVKNKKKDSDNVAFSCKYIFDGLVEAGAIPNDSMAHVLGIVHLFAVGDPRVDIYVYDSIPDLTC